MENNKPNETRIFLTILLLIFITLKLCDVIDWSWWWVLSPFWIPACIAIIIFAIALMIKIKERKKFKEWRKQNIGGTTSTWKEKLEEMQKRQAERNRD